MCGRAKGIVCTLQIERAVGPDEVDGRFREEGRLLYPGRGRPPARRDVKPPIESGAQIEAVAEPQVGQPPIRLGPLGAVLGIG